MEAGNLPCGVHERKQKLRMPSFSSLLLPILLLTACSSAERDRRVEKAHRFDLVDVSAVIPGISIDLRYATAQNVTSRAHYPSHMPCLLRRATAEKLLQAQQALIPQGYALRIWDAYRPPEVQTRLYEHSGHSGLFISPKTGLSRHSAGVCIDVTLIDSHGHEVSMPTGFDEDIQHASPDYHGPDASVKQHLSILQHADTSRLQHTQDRVVAL
jgi:zinc D-Ala-D-Ala dipeptidase